jgi:hypothetical protein
MGGTKLAETEIPMDQRKCPPEFLLPGSSSSSDEDDNKQPWKDDKGDSYDDDGDYAPEDNDDDDDGDYAPEDNDDDDDDFVDIEVESEDECRSSFPKEAKSKRGHPLLPGGPQKPDVSKMAASMAAMAQKAYRVKRKAWTDAQRHNRLKKNNTGSPPRECRGHVSDNLRPLEEVERHRLVAGHMFPSREILLMRIAEEAFLRGINIKAARVDRVLRQWYF